MTLELRYVCESTQLRFQAGGNFQTPNFTGFIVCCPDENLILFVYRPYRQTFLFCWILLRNFFSRLFLATHCRCREDDCCTWSLSVTHTHTHSLGRTPLNEGSSRRSVLYMHNTQHWQETDIHAPGGIRILCPSRRAAADLRLRPRGNLDCLLQKMRDQKWKYYATVLWHAHAG